MNTAIVEFRLELLLVALYWYAVGDAAMARLFTGIEVN